jgi:AcrR family transcriptional regulator
MSSTRPHSNLTVGRDRAATEARILDAARAVFARRGYDGAGLREVADVARANLSLVSRYFGGKEGLLSALTDRFIAARREGELSYPPQDTLAQEVHRYLHDRLEDDRANEAMVRLIVSRAAIDPGYRERTMHSMDARADANFRVRIDDLRKRGAVPDGTDVDLLFAAVVHFSFSVNFFGAMIGWRTDAEIDALFRAFSDAVGRGLPVPDRMST